MKIFPKLGFLDNPKKFGFSRSPIPYPGGIAPVLAFLILTPFFFILEKKILGILLATIILAIISFWDDRKNLSPIFRFSVHFLAAGIIVFSGVKIIFLGNPFGETINLENIFVFLPEILTAIFLVGFANVQNWLDGVPGISAICSAAAAAFLGILSLSPEISQAETAKLSFLIFGVLCGFLIFNFPPPETLFGDTGAITFGFLVATISVFSGGKTATILIVLAIPFLDAVYVFFSRIFSGYNPFSGKDNRHLHDRLKKIGFSDREILTLFLGISIFSGWISLQLQTFGKIIFLVSLAIIFFIFSKICDRIASKK